jgi:RNA polymerase sigma-70 factor (ECF subfamily)
MGKRAEARLVKLLQERNEAAFTEFVRQYSTTVYNLAFRMLGNSAEAEDISQEIFITVFKRIHTFRGDSSLSTWMYRVTINHCKNRIKYLARRHDLARLEYQDERSRRSSVDRSTAAVVHRPDELAEAREMEAIIQGTLEDLDEDHRTILVLRELQGLTYQQIGEVMQLEEGTVKSKLHRARSTFMRRIKGAYRDGAGKRGGER